ncbi:RHS repeat domain-containing protein [Sphingomonas sp. Sphisp140]|uniref:RHS repeat domain-containing protein n=1 Tax=Sphingomonas sp. Sphisp140 TaxID=3243019 RepID=UPI0039B02FAD
MTYSKHVERASLRSRRVALCLTTILCSGLLAIPASAQTSGPAPVRESIDGNGVDLFLGKVNYDGPELSAGQDNQTGLSYRQVYRGGAGGDSVWASLYVTGATTTVYYNGRSDAFTLSGSTYVSTEGNGATLSLSGTIYTYTGSDGTLIHLDKTKQGAYPDQSVIGLATDVTMPSGAVLTYSYDSLYYCVSYKQLSNRYTCLQHAYAYRPGSVLSKGGYKLKLNYNAIGSWSEADGDFPDFNTWSSAVSATMTNTVIAGSSARTQSFSNSWSGSTRYLTITDPMSRATVYRFATSGFGVTRPGKTAEDLTVVYDGSGRVANVTTPVGTTTYAYADASGVRTTTVTDPAGHATVYTFDIALQRMKSMTTPAPISKMTQWAYDTSGRVTRVTMPEGNYIQYTYDARGNVTETRRVAKTGPGAGDIVTTAGYDTVCSSAAKCNSPNWTKDANLNQTDYTYDTATGSVLTVTAPAATSGGTRPKTTYSYATTNGVQMLTGISTCQTTASCAGTSDESKQTIAYNGNLLPTTITRASGDGALSGTVTLAYDDVGNRISADGALAGSDDTTTYRYDADRELVGVITPDPDGAGVRKRQATRTTYNARGIATLVEAGTVNGTSDADWTGFAPLQQIASTLDAADRKVQDTSSAGGSVYGVTQYSYDSVGRLDCMAVRMNSGAWGSLPASACTAQAAGGDGPDRITRYAYDNANRPTKVTTAYGTADAADDVTNVYTDNGRTASLTDANGNVTNYGYDAFDRLSTTTYADGSYEQLGYDSDGNVTSRRLRDGTSIGYAYDGLNRMVTKTLPGGEPAVSYGYDLLGRPTTIAKTGSTITRSYDALSHLTSEGQPFGTLGYQYDTAGNRIRVTWWDGFFVTYDYDMTGRVTAIKENGTATLASYGYDDLGRRTSLSRGNGTSTSYGYDAVSRMTALSIDLAGTASDQSLGFGYNAASQVASTTRSNDSYAWTGAIDVDRGYAPNNLNQYATAGGTAFGYDARGNLTSSGTNSYAYSAENLLKSGPGVTLYYDGLGRLHEYDTATSTRFVYDGGNVAAEVDNPGGNVLRRYVYGPDGDEALMWYEGAGTSDKRWLHTDERGSVVAVTDASGGTLGVNSYDEYGIPASGNLGRLQYTGQAWLPDLGMYYDKARIYSPTLGRFLQTDPIGYGDGLNWYDYVGGDPINHIDPTGLECEVDENGNSNADCNITVNAPKQRATWETWDLATWGPVGGLIESTPGGGSLPGLPSLPPLPQNGPCGPTSLVPHGGGLSVGGSADAGLSGVAGAAVNASAGVGAFYSDKAGASVGGFASGGAAAYAGSNSVSAVAGSRPVVVGASGGAGVSVFITNAQSANQLSGPFDTYSLNVGFGPFQGTISLSVGGGIYQISASPPGAGLTFGASTSKITTTTVATKGC